MLIIAGLLQSCVNEVDDLFDTPAQQRVNEEIKACRALLTSSEFGWTMDYYPSAVQKYGGFAMTVKFEGSNATVASEITGDPTETATSLYSLKADMGPTLNFDTYNYILHYFSDPDNSGGAGLGKGYEGDYEFIIQSHSENEIILKGKKTKNIIRMTRLDKPSQDYLAPILSNYASIQGEVGILGYDGVLNGQNISISLPADRRLNIQAGNSLAQAAYIYTATGIRFYEPVSIAGTELSSLEWSDTKKTFIIDNTETTPVLDPTYEKYKRFLGEYTMIYDYGSQKRQIDVELVFKQFNASAKVYTLQGLPFPLEVRYNTERDCMEILTQKIGECDVAVWEIYAPGSLTWAAGLGLIGQLKEDTDNVYEFVDNGVWGTKIARALILWSASGEYKGFGGDTRFQNIVLIKK